MYEAIIWDKRDADKDEPASSLGTFDMWERALEAIHEYLQGEHRLYITRVEVVSR